MRSGRRVGGFLLGSLALGVAFATGVGVSSGPAGEARLVAFEPLPEYAGETCEWEVALPQTLSYAAAGAASAQLPDAASRLAVTARPPDRFIQDPYAAFSSVAVDPVRNEVVLTARFPLRRKPWHRTSPTSASGASTTSATCRRGGRLPARKGCCGSPAA